MEFKANTGADLRSHNVTEREELLTVAALLRDTNRDSLDLGLRLDRAARLLEQAGRRTTPDREAWISVDDRLPADGQMVAVYDPEHAILKVWPAQWDEKYQCFTAGSHGSAGWFERNEVTHWMPLPTAPNGEKK